MGLGVVGWVLAAGAMVPSSVLGQQPRSAKEAAPADHGIPQVAQINTLIRQGWTENELSPSPAATDTEWCRRVFLDILGRVPSVQELKAFMTSTAPDKRLALVNELLEGEQYTEEYARNWTTIWTNILIGRAGGTERNSLTSREGMQKYLRDSFARNKPYNRLVYELVTATGANSPGAENFNGAVNFLAMKVNEEKGTLATAATARIFLGMQVQCTQCHDHPFNEWKQQKFWDLNSFFRQTRALRQFVPGTNDVASAELVDESFEGEGTPSTPEEAEVYFELRNGKLQAAYPVFVDGTPIADRTDSGGNAVKGSSGYLEDVHRREELGKMITQSEYLELAIANRYWGHFLGYGFTKPVDDLGPHNRPSHPELLKYLGEELRRNSFNLKELIRWIVLSEPYALSSRVTPANAADDPQLGEKPQFTHFYLRQMQAEELYESLLVATQAHKTRGSYEEQEKAKSEWLAQFVSAFGNDEGEEATTFNGSIPQALMMFNGDLVKRATSADKGSFLEQIAASKLSPSDKIDYLFLSGLARKPSQAELRIANQLLLARKGDAGAALQDVWWAVLNSNEFIMNH